MNNESNEIAPENETVLDVPPPRVPRVLVEMEGGLIQSVCSDSRVDVLIFDRDLEGSQEEPTVVQFNDEEDEAITALYMLEPVSGSDAAWINATFAAVAAKIGTEE